MEKRLINATRTKVKPTLGLENQIGKLPPQVRDVEEAVLGALMIEKDALTKVIEVLKPDAFYVEAHKLIYKAIQDLFSDSQPIDLITVTNQLRKSGDLETVGGAFYIMELTSKVASSAHVENHARLITEKYILRELIRISAETITEGYDPTTDVFDLLDRTESELFKVAEGNIKRGVEDMNTLIHMAIKQIESIKDSDGVSGVPSGFIDLDRITAGWQKATFVVLAARPAMGKTAFVLSLARNAAVTYKKRVAIFSLEMSSIELVNRLISAETEIPGEKLKKGNLEPHEWQQLTTKIAKLEQAPIFIDDTAGISIFDLRAKCRRLKAQHQIDMVVIDYLQLMSGSGDKNGNREQEIAQISRALKGISKELDIPVIALSQLSRAVESRGGDKRPMLSDLRESGSIEQDADMVMFIYRPEYYKIDQDSEGNSLKGIATIIIAKHRSGQVADVDLRFEDKFARFTNLEHDHFSFKEAGLDNFKPQTLTFGSKMNDNPGEAPF